MSTELLNETKTHNGQAAPTPLHPHPHPPNLEPTPGSLGDKGDDSFNINIPSGSVFERAELEILEGKYNRGARVDEQPNPGDTGSGKTVKVHWYFDGGPGQAYIKYRIKAFVTLEAELRPEHKVSGFLPSTSGLHFVNAFYNVNVTIPFGQVNIPLRNPLGACGGMAFAVRDYFESGFLVPPDTATPSSGTLYDYIRGRLIDSFNLPGGPKNYMDLMDPTLPDGDTPPPPLPALRHGRAWRMVKEEWPKIKSDIDNERLSPMGLVLVKSPNPLKLVENHQVLAYGYTEYGPYATIYIYDPNHPDNDRVTITLKVDDPRVPANITCPSYASLNSFFHNDYAKKTPPKQQSTPCAKAAFQAWNNKYMVAEGGWRWSRQREP